MSRFLYLYRNSNEQYDAAYSSPEKMQQMMQKWIGWMQELRAAGHISDGGAPLQRSGRIVGKNGGSQIQDGPYLETKDVVGGFTVVEAADIEQAVALAHGCPIHQLGGCVEVRPIREID